MAFSHKRIARRRHGGQEKHNGYGRVAVPARSFSMLWTIAVILLVLWLVGWLGFHILGGFIHILILLAVVAAVVALVKKV